MSVTIASAVFWADWPYDTDTTFQVRAKSSKAWISEESEVIPANVSRIVGTGSITALRATIPSITLPSTSAGLDDQTARWTVTLHRTGKSGIVHTVLDNFPLPDSFEPAATWAQIKINKNGKQPLRDTSVYTKTETNTQIALAVGTLNDASTTVKGRAKASYPPLIPTEPIFVSNSDPRLKGLSSGGRLIFASSVAALNSNLTSGGGTDDTAALQAILNTASTVGQLVLIVDGVALVSGLDIKSNTTLIFPEGAGLYLKNSSNRAILRNANQTEGSFALIANENIRIVGGYFNGNRANQTKLASGTIVSGEWVVGFQFFGVKNLWLENIHVYQSKNFSVHLANFQNVTLRGVWVEQPNYTVDNHDGIHLNGPGQFLTADHIRCTKTSDDGFAINGFDPVNIHTGVTNGPITDISITNIFLDSCYFGIRLMGNSNSDYVDRVFIQNVYGTVQEYWLRLDSGSQYSGPGVGDIRRVTVNGVSVSGALLGTSLPEYDEAVRVESFVESLTIKGYKQNKSWYPDYRPMIRVRASGGPVTNDWCPGGCPITPGDIRSLDLEISVYDPAGTDPTGGGSVKAGYRVQNEGNITRARIYVDHFRDGSVARTNGLFWNKGGSLGELIATGGANRQTNTFALTAGSWTFLRLPTFNDNDNGGSVVLVSESGGTITSYPSISGDIFANANTTWLGGTHAANVGIVNLTVDGRQTLKLGATLSVSSNTVTPTGSVHHINDAGGLIKTITVPAGFMGGCIRLIAGTTPFTTDTTANISRAVSPAAGQAVEFCYSATSAKWHPSL